MAYEQVRYETAGKVARVTLNRPQYHNAQSSQLLKELDAALADAVADDSVRVIVLRGEGESFSSGHDLGTPEQAASRAARAQGTTEAQDRFDYSWEHFLDMSLRWRDLPKPTIAAVHGWCIFGGWLIASAMDLIVASDDARFMTALLQYFPLPFDVGPRKAKELLFDSRQMSAAEACAMGFVNRVVPRDRLDEETMAMAGRIAENNAFYLRMVKSSVNAAQDAMGFRSAVVGAHAHYLLSELSNRQWARKKARDKGEPVAEDTRRLALVDRMLTRQSEEGGG